MTQIAEKLDLKIEGEDMIKHQLTHYLSQTAEDTDFEIQAKKLQRLISILVDSYLESDDIDAFDEFLVNLGARVKKTKSKK